MIGFGRKELRMQNKESPRLRECPFCGGDAKVEFVKRKKLFAKFRYPYVTHVPYVCCKVCLASSHVKWTEESVIEAWNRRVGAGK
jgi:Lar family restriction alleviation protein